MRLVVAAILLLVGWQLYHLGYKNGLRASPEYSSAIAKKALGFESERIERLEALLAAYPSKEQCVPVLLGEQIDEYSFCEELLAESRTREAEAQDAMSNEQ